MLKNNNKYKTQSAAKWATELNITVLNFNKSFTLEEYYDANINRAEFLNRISICEIKKPENLSRREMAKMKSELSGKNNN